MPLSNFLTQLIVPLNLCITLLVLAVLLYMVRCRRLAGILAIFSLCWGVFWSLPASSLWAGGRLEQYYPYVPPSQMPQAEAIVVLGGNTASGRPNWFEPYQREAATTRADTALQLYRAGRAPLIVLSGASLDGSVSEARAMANALERAGVPASALILEDQSQNTHENALYSARVLRDRHIEQVLLVTSALHMPRSMAAFARQGVHATPAPSPPQIVVPDDPAVSFWLPDHRTFDAARSIIKEYAGLLVYWLRGWI